LHTFCGARLGEGRQNTQRRRAIFDLKGRDIIIGHAGVDLSQSNSFAVVEVEYKYSLLVSRQHVNP